MKIRRTASGVTLALLSATLFTLAFPPQAMVDPAAFALIYSPT